MWRQSDPWLEHVRFVWFVSRNKQIHPKSKSCWIWATHIALRVSNYRSGVFGEWSSNTSLGEEQAFQGYKMLQVMPIACCEVVRFCAVNASLQ